MSVPWAREVEKETAHELRTPLTSIQNSVSNILAGVTGKVADKTRQYLYAMKMDCHRFADLINDLLDVAKLEAGNMPITRKVMDLDALIRTAVKEFHEESVPYGLSLTLVGMLIVFSALLVTSIVVSQLRIVNKKPKTEEMPMVIDQKGKLVAERKTQDRNEVAAAIMALHMYETGIKERRKMMLTIKRTPTNQWRTSQVLEMPNRELFRFRR
mgnify:CR=1 FL=1